MFRDTEMTEAKGEDEGRNDGLFGSWLKDESAVQVSSFCFLGV